MERSMGNNQLGQARKRRKKVRITDIAITKVPYTEYPGLTDTECKTIRALAMEVLELSKEENDDNEVSITYCLEDRSIGICFGDEHGVNLPLFPDADGSPLARQINVTICPRVQVPEGFSSLDFKA